MRLRHTATALLAAALAGCLAAGTGTAAWAADLKVKALPVKAPPPSPWVLDVHGSVDFTIANTRVTGGGLFLYPTGSLLFQQTTGVQLDVYKDKSSFINSFSVFGGLWNEVYTDPNGFQTAFKHWQEMDWWAGANIGFAEHWTLNGQHLEFVFPWDGSIKNDVFKLSFDDSYWGYPITINPYFQVFYVESGGSSVLLGRTSSTERLEVGIVPTYSLMKPYGVPITLSAPTWVDFGPTDFWNRADGTTNLCGPTSTLPCALSNWGYFSSGLTAKYTFPGTVVPTRLGSWYLKGGVQWFHMLNDALLAAQGTGGLPPGMAETAYAGTAAVAGFPQAKKDIAVVSGSVGFAW
jgi:hypothetical protein